MNKLLTSYKIAQRLEKLGYDNPAQWYCEDLPMGIYASGRKRTTKPFERVKYTLHTVPLSNEEFRKFKEIPIVEGSLAISRREPSQIIGIPSVQEALSFLKEAYNVKIESDVPELYSAKYRIQLDDGKVIEKTIENCHRHHAEFLAVVVASQTLLNRRHKAA